MSEMIENTQKEAELAADGAEPADQNFATVYAVYTDGLTLTFDGTAVESSKHYKCNTAIKFAAGDRVRIIKDSGTYIVEYAVGAPLTATYADTAGAAVNVTENINSKAIADIFEAADGITAKKATAAVNVTTNINGKAISSIFESDGITAKKATSVEEALRLLNASGDTYYVLLNSSHALIPSSTAVTFDIGGVSTWFETGYFRNLILGGNNSYNVLVNESRELRPNTTSTSYPCYLGTVSYPWHYAYIGSNTVMLGTASASKLGFFGTTPIARQTLDLTSNNMGYSSVTASNYLYALNNLIGILKSKYGLFA